MVLLVGIIGYNVLIPTPALSDSAVEYPQEGNGQKIQSEKTQKKVHAKTEKKKSKRAHSHKRKIKAPLDRFNKRNAESLDLNAALQKRKNNREKRIARLPHAEDVGPKVLETYTANVTYYASTPGQTDGSPYNGASGARVHWGMVAANCFPFGTKLRIPDVYGDKIFTVLDRHSTRYGCKGLVDVWTDYSPGQNPRTVHSARIEVIEEF